MAAGRARRGVRSRNIPVVSVHDTDKAATSATERTRAVAFELIGRCHYQEEKDGLAAAAHFCFYADKVEIEVDGQRVTA